MNWHKLKAHLWCLAGNSRTVLVAYGLEAAGYVDEAKYFDWSSLIGSERAGRVVAFCGGLMIVMRILTKGAVLWQSILDSKESPNAR